jgi:hypothetical protein
MKNIFLIKQEKSSSPFIDSNMSKNIYSRILKGITSSNRSMRLIILLIFSLVFTYSTFAQAVVTYEASVPSNQSGNSGTVTVTYTRNNATFNANGTGKVATDFPASFTVTFPWASYKTNVWSSGPGSEAITSGIAAANTQTLPYPTNTSGGSVTTTLNVPKIDFWYTKSNLTTAMFTYNKGYSLNYCSGGDVLGWLQSNSNASLLTTTAPYTVTGANPAPPFYTSNVLDINRNLPAASTLGTNISYMPTYTRFSVSQSHSSNDNDCSTPGNKCIAKMIGTDQVKTTNRYGFRGNSYSDPTTNRSLVQFAFTRSTSTNNTNGVNTGTDLLLEPISLSMCVPSATPTLSGTALNITCPATSVDLNSLVTSSTPTNTSLVWYTNNTHTGTAYATPTAATAGTYYGYYYDAMGGCYSPATAAVTVTGICCPNGVVSYSMYATYNNSATMNTGWGTSALGAPNIFDASTNVVANRLLANSVYPDYWTFNYPIHAGDTITFWANRPTPNATGDGFNVYVGTAWNGTYQLVGSIAGSAITSTGVNATYVGGPYTKVQIVVPATVTGTSNIAVQAAPFSTSSGILFDAVQVSNTYCNTCPAGVDAPILSDDGGICAPATTFNVAAVLQTICHRIRYLHGIAHHQLHQRTKFLHLQQLLQVRTMLLLKAQ